MKCTGMLSFAACVGWIACTSCVPAPTHDPALGLFSIGSERLKTRLNDRYGEPKKANGVERLVLRLAARRAIDFPRKLTIASITAAARGEQQHARAERASIST